jgi:tetratricopeptide (TPR) repeat protein
MRAVAVFGAAAAVLSVAAGAQAQTQQSPLRTVCADDKTTPDMRISACTVIILEGRETPGNLAVTYYNRSLGYGAEGDYDRAIADYTKAIELDPKFARAYNNRGTVYGIKGDHDRAIADFAKAIGLDPKNANAYNNRCLGLAVSGRAQSALTDCDTALRLRPDYADAFDNRGFAYYQLARYDKALADYEAALKLAAKSASSLYGRGMTKLKKGDPAGDADIAAAKAIQPDIADEMARYGMK